MLMRTTTRSVTFDHPFRLDGIDEMQPAGTYVIESEEELLQGLSFPAWRRRLTMIRLPQGGGDALDDLVATIDAAALEVALLKDADGESLQATAVEDNRGMINADRSREDERNAIL